MTVRDDHLKSAFGWWLILGIALTRIPALGTLHLPDASVAAFFLGGLYLASGRAFGLLILAAFLADLVAFRVGLVSPACLTPAYGFLVPTYFLVWSAGRSLRGPAMAGHTRWWLARGLFRVLLASLGAFTLSNAAYYGFAVDGVAMGWIGYASTVAHYLPAYAGETLVYVMPVLVAERWLIRRGRSAGPVTA